MSRQNRNVSDRKQAAGTSAATSLPALCDADLFARFLDGEQASFTVLYHRYALREGSGGAGKHRGGLGLEYEIELRRGDATASFVMDHGRYGPQGALGGEDGAVNEVEVWRDGQKYIPEHLSKEQDIALKAGDRVRVRTPGGGGYGDPADRDPDLVAEDKRLGRA